MLAENAPFSRGLAACLCITAFLSFFTNAVARVFGFIPAHTFSVHTYPWNLLTYIAVEPNPFLCAASVAFLLHIAAPVESSMGTFAYAQLVLATTAATSVSLLLLSALLYAGGVTWFLQCFSGLWPVAGAVLVPWVAMAPAARSSAPALLLGVALATDLLLRRRRAVGEEDVDGDAVFPGTAAAPALAGIGVAWARGAGGRIELAALMGPIAAQWRRGRGAGGGPTRGESDSAAVAMAVPRGATVVTLLPGSTEEDAERRRAIAIAALSSRLQQQQQQQQGAPVSQDPLGGVAKNDLPI